MKRIRLPGAAALVLAVLLAYLPALQGGLLWDDDRHLTPPELRSPGGLVRIWTELGATQQYYPLLHSAFWLQHRLWGDAMPGYHLATVGQHALAAILLALVLRRLAVPGAWLAAWLFALHPVHVESVAWISEQKNTLSAVFCLGAALAYLKFDTKRRPAHYRLALGLYTLGLMTKTVVAVLPAALLVVFWWQRGRLRWRADVAPLVPWLALGLAAGLVTAGLERAVIGATGPDHDLSALQRVLLAPRSLLFYAANLVWPANLTFIYPRWTVEPAQAAAWLPFLAVLAIGALCLRARSRTPLAVSLLFSGALFPALGFFNVYPFRYSFVADHFQYLASLPALAALAAGLVSLPPLGRWPGVLLAAVCGALTWQQAHAYRDLPTLYRHTLARNPACWMAHNNLGRELLAVPAARAEAIACFERALALRPDYWEARNNLGLALAQSDRPAAGVPHLEAAVRLKPHAPETHNNLGIALARSGRPAAALHAFSQAAALGPDLPNVHENWAKALLRLGRRAEAEQRFEIARRLRAAASAN